MAARIRTIKPEFFRHVGLYQAEQDTGLPLRIAFAGLFTVVDREGRFRWSPPELKLDCLPYDAIDMARVLDALLTRRFLVKYEVDGRPFGCIPSFTRHQVLNPRERASVLPAPPEIAVNSTTLTEGPRVNDASTTRHIPAREEGEQGMEGNGKGEVEGNAPDGAPTRGAAASSDELTQAWDLFNVAAECNGWPKCAVLSSTRKTKLRHRLRDAGGLSGWETALKKAAASDFLMGRTTRDEKHSNWRFDIEFLLRQDRFAKLMEGGYDNVTKAKRMGPVGIGPGSGTTLEEARRATFEASCKTFGISPEDLR